MCSLLVVIFWAAAQVVELMGTRKGQMQGMAGGMEGGSRVTYTIPTRGLLGAAHALPQTVLHAEEPKNVLEPNAQRNWRVWAACKKHVKASRACMSSTAWCAGLENHVC